MLCQSGMVDHAWMVKSVMVTLLLGHIGMGDLNEAEGPP